eukprot:gnl/TRDRNA2_/TRDRNA2_206280_c0_seq1.p1 gnl/TRDRNA2_/TRDRNA2_206280_c0~~gnl/TRDRNA2_/TRDRNA2_206280_c0_seq1.p1  ORF type:complete len:155 (+),score=6.13 gnl/TRDRNA2_/TRDRNA2_206280_c0_seq1:60-524(+)
MLACPHLSRPFFYIFVVLEFVVLNIASGLFGIMKPVVFFQSMFPGSDSSPELSAMCSLFGMMITVWGLSLLAAYSHPRVPTGLLIRLNLVLLAGDMLHGIVVLTNRPALQPVPVAMNLAPMLFLAFCRCVFICKPCWIRPSGWSDAESSKAHES